MTPAVQPKPMRIVEVSQFSKDVAVHLKEQEKRALALLLVETPTSGQQVKEAPGVWAIEFAGCRVEYCFSPEMDVLFLLTIEPLDAIAPVATSQEHSELKKVLRALGVAGVIAVAKSGLKWLWELMG
jgi:hypothetical protein